MKLYSLSILIISGFILLHALPCSALDDALDPFQPSVSAEENRIIQAVLETATADVPTAIQELTDKINPATTPALDFILGNLYWQNDNLAKAADAYQAALDKLPNFRSAMINLGRVYLLQDKTEETIRLYQRLVENRQANADTYLLLGHALMLDDAPVSAESAYRQALLLQPRDSEARTGLTKALFQQERYTEGLSLLDEILNAQPLNEELWSLKTDGLLSKGAATEAITALEQARRLDCATPDMLATLGDLYLNAQLLEDAVRSYEAAFSVQEPDLNRMLRAAEGFLMLADASAAKAMLQKAESLPEKSRYETLSHLRIKAELAMLEHKWGEAKTMCETILALDPLDGKTLLNLAEIQLEEGEPMKAVLSCERAARIEGFEADALVLHARIEVMNNHYKAAADLLESAQVFEPRPYVADYLEQIRRLSHN